MLERVHLSPTTRGVSSVSLRIRWPRIICKYVQEKRHVLHMDSKKKKERIHSSTVKQQLVCKCVLVTILNVSYSYKFVISCYFVTVSLLWQMAR